MIRFLFFCFSLSNTCLTAHAQSPWIYTTRLYDVDSMGYEWTATSEALGRLYVATLPESDSLSVESGALRLRRYDAHGTTIFTAQTSIYLGNLRVNSMEYTGTQLFFGGYRKDTSYFDSSTIIPAHLGAKNAFIVAKNVLTDSIQWVWHDPFQTAASTKYGTRIGLAIPTD